MNEAQLKAVEELKEKNIKYIKKLELLIKKIDEEYSVFDEFENDFWELMNEMEESSSQTPFLPFCNAYCIKDDKFVKPMTSCIVDPLYGTMGPNFNFLSEEFMDSLCDEFEIEAKKMREVLSDMVEEMQELIDCIISSNSITRRLSGLENKLTELEDKTKLYWYPSKLSQSEYGIKGSIPVPLCVRSYNIVYPFHRKLIIKYDYLFKSKNIHNSLLRGVKTILNYINEYLPFAELVPLKENSGINITNQVNPSLTQIGSDNEMKGDISIGNGGEK